MRSTRDVLEAVKNGKITTARAETILKLNALSVVDEIARLDLNRYLRRGVPEIVFSKSKTSSQLRSIFERFVREAQNKDLEIPFIASKVSKDQADFLMSEFSRNTRPFKLKYYPEASIIALLPNREELYGNGRVALLCAGTSDISILNEAEIITKLMGCQTIRFNDVGIASLRRLSTPLKRIQKFDPDAIIVAAGMEAALPSLIASLSSVPIIGLPTSVGYGYGKNGEAALMSMLQACPLGICVVNIDGGVAAGIIASIIARRSSQNRMNKFD